MKVGINLPGVGPPASATAIVDLTRLSSELGFDSVWVSDHVAMPARVDSRYPYSSDGQWPFAPDFPWPDPLLVLAIAAATSSNIELGTSVVILPLRNPIVLAKQIATLSALANRRLWLGVGTGWMQEEFKALGVEFEHRGPRSEEMVELMRRLWTGRPTSFDGKFFQADQLTNSPVPAIDPVVLWGGNSTACLRRVARTGDGWFPLDLSREELDSGLDRLKRLCEEAGRDFASVPICIGIGDSSRFGRDDHAWYERRGVGHIVLEPHGDLHMFRAELARLAQVCDNASHLKSQVEPSACG